MNLYLVDFFFIIKETFFFINSTTLIFLYLLYYHYLTFTKSSTIIYKQIVGQSNLCLFQTFYDFLLILFKLFIQLNSTQR